MLIERAQPRVELTPQTLHLSGLLGHVLVLPAHRYCAQQGKEGAGGGDDDVALKGELQQFGVHAQGGIDKGIRRHKEDDELRGWGKGIDVVLAGQRLNMAAHEMRVVAEETRAILRVLALHGVQIGAERNLGVHDDAASARQVDHQVGAHGSAVEVRGDLRIEVDVLAHPSEFHDALQLHLAPAAANIGGAERADQLVCAVGELRGSTRDCLHLTAQCCQGGGSVRLQLLELQPEAVHGFFQRGEFRLSALGLLEGAMLL